MTTAAEVLREAALPGRVPRHELIEWRERFGLVAGITARGGAEGRGFDLGLWTDAPVAEVMTRWREFRSAEPGVDLVVLGSQVHGAEVAYHDPRPPARLPDRPASWLILDGVDGHATRTPGVLLAVTVADCIPVYLHDRATGTVALLHAGWRGTAGGILERALGVLARHAGTSPDDLVMHCGVGICGGCYEVGSEVVEGVRLRADGDGPWHVDLRERLADQARRLGIAEVSSSAWCTAHDRPLFYSHRASRGRDGRMVAYLGIPRG